MFKRETAFSIGLGGLHYLSIVFAERGDGGPAYRLSGGCIHNAPGDSTGAGSRAGALLLDGVLRGTQNGEHQNRSADQSAERAPACRGGRCQMHQCPGTSTTRLLEPPGSSVTACPWFDMAAMASGLRYSSCTAEANV